MKLYKNILRAYKLLKTTYFCVLDADDYWESENFIQNGLDFLENNKDCTIYITNVLQKMPDGSIKEYSKFKSGKTSFKDYLNVFVPFTQTSGCIYRNVIFINGVSDKLLNPPYKSWEFSFRGDTFRNLIHLDKGLAYNCENYDTVYRITDEGLWQGITKMEQYLLNATVFKDLYVYFDMKYPKFLFYSDLFYNKIKNNFFENITNINSESSQIKILHDIKNLKSFYNKKEEEIRKIKFNSANFKERIKLIFTKK